MQGSVVYSLKPEYVLTPAITQTTTCCYYATLHLDASKVLADTVHEYGQRGFIGVRPSPSLPF